MDPLKEHWPRIDIRNNGWVERKNTQLILVGHTFDIDDDINSLTIKYELKWTMNGQTIEKKLIEEFDLMPFKKEPPAQSFDYRNSFIFENKKYYISDIQPNFKNAYRMNIEITRTQPTTSMGNKSMLRVEIRHFQNMKEVNDAR